MTLRTTFYKRGQSQKLTNLDIIFLKTHSSRYLGLQQKKGKKTNLKQSILGLLPF